MIVTSLSEKNPWNLYKQYESQKLMAFKPSSLLLLQ